MSTVLFKVFPASSHHNATFPLATALRARGHRVVYTASKEMAGHVGAQNFEFHQVEKDFLPCLNPPAARKPRLSEKVSSLRYTWLDYRRGVAAQREAFNRCNFFDDLLQTIQPDAVLVDSPYGPFTLSLLRSKVRFGILESMVNLNYDPLVPPLSSSACPVRPSLRTLYKLYYALLWGKVWARGWAMGKLDLDVRRSKTLSRTLRQVRAPSGYLNTRRYFHLGLNNVPEFIVSPREFDFPRQSSANQYYIGPSVDLSRKEVGVSYYFESIWKKLQEGRSTGQRLVYCALGTMSWRYPGIEGFFTRLLKAASGANWSLLIALGDELDARQFGPLPDNVYICQRVPQLRVLTGCDMMVTHGGMNSITECILLGVPMVACPGDDKIDQCGNAARVVYHRIGQRLSLQHASSLKIRQTIDQVVSDDVYRARVRAMGVKIKNSEAYKNGAEIVESVLGLCPITA